MATVATRSHTWSALRRPIASSFLVGSAVALLALISCSGTHIPSDVDRAGIADHHEALGDMDGPPWTAALDAPWPRWVRSVRDRPAVLRFGYAPLLVGDTFEEQSTRVSRLERDVQDVTQNQVSFVYRNRHVRATVATVGADESVEEVRVTFGEDHALVHTSGNEAREPSVVAGNSYACHIAGNRVSVRRLSTSQTGEVEGVTQQEHAFVWQAVRPLIQGQLVARSLANRTWQVGEALDLSWGQIAVLIGAERHWYTESAKATLRGRTRIEEKDCALLDVKVRARVAGGGGTLQTVDLEGRVALHETTGRVVAVELMMATHLQSASLDTATIAAFTETFGIHRIRTRHSFGIAAD